jgi:serine/threonine protein kinase
MVPSPSVQGFFQALVTEQLISRAIEVTVGMVVAGPAGAVAAPILSKAVEYYGLPVASRIWSWIKGQRPVEACTTLEAVANLDAQTARAIIEEVVERTAPGAIQEAKTLTKNYLASIPATLRQTLPRASSGKSTCPAALLPRDEQDVFRLLPTFLPPYNAPCPLPGTPYHLQELVGTGGFGAVYKATSQYESAPRALKFCLDPDRTAILKREKDRLDRLVKQEEGSAWPENVVRLIGHCLDHVTPFLIFEYVPDGDMGVHVQNLRVKLGRSLNSEEALALMRQLTLAVSQVHAAGLIHRDLKPSNILFAGLKIKIADFGLGAVVPHQGRTVSRQRSSAETTQEMRGAGSVLYMSKEQKRGAAADPVQDVYSLGVIWYQVLVNDFSEEPGISLERRLAEQAVPAKHTELLKKCLDDRPGERPKSAGELVASIDRLVRRADEEEEAARQAAIRQKQAQEEATRRAQDEADWTKAQQQGVGGYRTYLEKWPSGRNASNAKQMIERREAGAKELRRKVFLYSVFAMGGALAGATVLGGVGGLLGAVGWTSVVFLVIGLVSGAAVGAVIGLLLSPFGGIYKQKYIGDCSSGERYVFGPVSKDVVKGFAIVAGSIGAICGAIGVIVTMIQPNYKAYFWEWTPGEGCFWGSAAGLVIGLVAGLILAFQRESN